MFSLIIIVLTIVGVMSTTYPPRAHELDASYTFDQYLLHFSKSYNDREYSHRFQIFQSNLQRILDHNQGRMDEAGNVINGYVMGINAFTDRESSEIPMGFSREMHPAWRGQLNNLKEIWVEKIISTERKLVDASYVYLVSTSVLRPDSVISILCIIEHSPHNNL